MKILNHMVLSGISFKEGIPLPFKLSQSNETFILMLICFLLFAYKYREGFAHLQENITSVFSFRKDRTILYNHKKNYAWYTYCTILQFTIISSVIIYNILTKYYSAHTETIHHPFRTITLFILLISVFVILKNCIYKYAGYIYNKKNEMYLFRHSQAVIIDTLGLLFFIPTLFLIYTDYLHIGIIIFLISLFILSQLILFYRIIFYFFREKFSFLFMIAYLCSIEIIPYIFMAVGLIFLYKTDELTVLWLK